MDSKTILPLREGNGPTLFCFHPAPVFAWQFSVLSRYLDPQWSIIGIQSPRPSWPHAGRTANLDEVCERIWQTLLEQQPHRPILPAGLFTWRYCWREGICGGGGATTACPRRNQVAFSWLAGYLAARNAKTGRKRNQWSGSGSDWRRLTASAKPSWRTAGKYYQRSCLPPIEGNIR